MNQPKLAWICSSSTCQARYYNNNPKLSLGFECFECGSWCHLVTKPFIAQEIDLLIAELELALENNNRWN